MLIVVDAILYDANASHHHHDDNDMYSFSSCICEIDYQNFIAFENGGEWLSTCLDAYTDEQWIFSRKFLQ